MRLLITIASLLYFYGSAFAASPLDKISSIICSDANPQTSLTLNFTSDGTAAHKYTRRSGTIPFEYSNLASLTVYTGVLTLQNDPANSDGKWILMDNDTFPGKEVTLTLTQILDQPIAYRGEFSGPLTKTNANKSDNRVDRVLICQVAPSFDAVSHSK